MCSNHSIIAALGARLWYDQTSSFEDTEKVLSNKIVLLYFSASWCAPCQHFTPQLSQTYKALKAKETTEPFEVVFVSMDKNEEQYATYCAKMPFYALPFGMDISSLARRYRAQGIPHLVVLDKNDSTIIVEDGVGEVAMDPTGEHFPWRPKALSQILPSYYLNTDKELSPISDLKDNFIMLYFSAHWCPPCRSFTPKLVKAYTNLKTNVDSKFELLFVSADNSQDEFDEYFQDMNFGAVPYQDENARSALTKGLAIRGYPTLLMLSATNDSGERTLINPNIRGIIETSEYISEFPYFPKHYGDLNHTPSDINEHRCIIVFHESGDDEEHEGVIDAIKLASARSQNVHMYWAIHASEVTKSVRAAVKLPQISGNATMILLDIPDDGGYYLYQEESDVTEDVIVEFLQNPGERLQLEG